MTRNRRTYLATLGALAFGGCLSDSTDPTPTARSQPATDERTTETTSPTAEQSTTDDNTTATPERDETTIGFAGDTMVGRSLNQIYGQDDVDPAAIWGDFKSELDSLDGVCCNLECCLSKRGEKYPNRAFYFRGDPEWAVPALDAGNITFTALANNHAMDYGTVALKDTIEVLEASGITNAGTGEAPAAAWEPATFSVGSLDVAVVSFSEEGSAYAVTDDRPGIAWATADPGVAETRRVVGDAIERAKETDPDVLVASVHWGENWIERPSDRLVSFGHWLVDQGVDLVHGHSAHIVQAVEQYGDGVILHDTADLIDDFGVKGDLGNDKSYLFEVTLTGNEISEIRLVPFYIGDHVYPASETDATWLRKTIRERSAPFETTYERDGEELVVRL